MQQQIMKFEKYIDRLSSRDQIALLVIIIVAVMMIWFHLIYQPLNARMMLVEKDIMQKETEIVTLQAKTLMLQKNINADPDAENRQQLNKYLEEKARLEEALVSTSIQIINPQEMAKLLEQLLKNQSGLKFISMKNKPATSEFIKTPGDSQDSEVTINTIYRHSVVLQMEGSYHNAMTYLKALEQFPWRFFWQSIEIETSNYPNTVITLEVYTLGLREGLIGA